MKMKRSLYLFLKGPNRKKNLSFTDYGVLLAMIQNDIFI